MGVGWGEHLLGSHSKHLVKSNMVIVSLTQGKSLFFLLLDVFSIGDLKTVFYFCPQILYTQTMYLLSVIYGLIDKKKKKGETIYKDLRHFSDGMSFIFVFSSAGWKKSFDR